MATYIYAEQDYREQFDAAGDEAALQTGKRMISEGDYGQDSITATLRVHADIYRVEQDEDGKYEESVGEVTHDFEPDEPRCTEPEGHEWGDGDPAGHAGGVIIRSRCPRCEAVRVLDTWDTDRYDGTPMETVSYTTAG